MIYEEYTARTKYTLMRKTTYCDHSTTTEVVSVSYSDTTYICHLNTGYGCSPGSTYIPPCVF